MTKLGVMAGAVRSANAGASLRTFDVMFDDERSYDRVVKAGVLVPATIGPLYNLPSDSIKVYEYPPAFTVKITMPRSVMAGNPDDTDIDGKQQHAPLLEIEVPD